MNTSATYSADGLRHDVADPATWSVRVCADRCATCIFRPGNLMNLDPGRVASMVKKAVADEGHIVCHDTLGTEAPAICAGFAVHPRGRAASLALRLARAGVLKTVLVQPDRETKP
ncbi:hypothetical protein TPA0598_04_02970 [Streptomyces lydicamycinicus]|uniref:Uncharacterized protein n=1 Tax=Streptomyces lydicamycinicus TaxID=1546107 RepID=A0A0P4R7V7_9ACTN|nr:hypothetical protein [Streptomyces lydicamycinicus]GAO08661.1 hypothetical protein TPA0598_04_02970 [Streptomyces lydicamycinicus]